MHVSSVSENMLFLHVHQSSLPRGKLQVVKKTKTKQNNPKPFGSYIL